MQQIVINRPPNRGLPAPGLHHRYGAIIFGAVTAAANRIVTLVVKFFQMIGFCLFSVVSWPGDRLIDYLIGRYFCKLLASMRVHDVSEREAARAFLLQLTRGRDWLSIGEEILKAVMEIPAAEREEVFTSVLLIAPGREDYRMPSLIRAVAHLSVNERAHVIALALRVITPDMDGFKRIDIVKTVARIRPEEREEVVTNALLLIIPAMRCNERILLIREIADHVPVNERGQVITFTLSVTTACLDVLFMASVFRAVAGVPAREREDVMRFALQVITDAMQYQRRVAVIQLMARAPADERANLVQRFREGGEYFSG